MEGKANPISGAFLLQKGRKEEFFNIVVDIV